MPFLTSGGKNFSSFPSLDLHDDCARQMANNITFFMVICNTNDLKFQDFSNRRWTG